MLVPAFSNQNNPEHLSVSPLILCVPLQAVSFRYQKRLRELARMLSFSMKVDISTYIVRDEQNKDAVPVLNFGSGNT